MLCSILLSFSAISKLHAKNNDNNNIEYILQVKEASFDRAITTEEKINIISNKFNFVFEQNNNNINALALAIAYGDKRRVEKFLDIVDDINDENLWVSVYDYDEPEPYTLADVAINPENIIDTDDSNLLDYYAIIQLLINKKIKFNITPKEAYEKLPSYDKIHTSNKQRTTEIIALFDTDHPYNEAPFLACDRFQTPTSKSFHIMYICGEIYGYENLDPAIDIVFKKGLEKFKRMVGANLEAA